MATGQSELTLRFLAAPTDVAFLGGSVHGGRVLEWIDKAAYAPAIADFYLTNPIARASAVMAQCSQLAAGGFAIAAE